MPNVSQGMSYSTVGDVHWDTRISNIAGDAVFPGEVLWGTRIPTIAGDAVFPGEIH